MRLTKALKTELLLGCAKCGKRFIDAKSVKKNWKNVKYLTTPNIVAVDEDAIYLCDQCVGRI